MTPLVQAKDNFRVYKVMEYCAMHGECVFILVVASLLHKAAMTL